MGKFVFNFVDSGQLWPDLGQMCANFAEFGPM